MQLARFCAICIFLTVFHPMSGKNDSIHKNHTDLIYNYIKKQNDEQKVKLISVSPLNPDSLLGPNNGEKMKLEMKLWKDSVMHEVDSMLDMLKDKYHFDACRISSIRGYYKWLSSNEKKELLDFFLNDLIGDISEVFDVSEIPKEPSTQIQAYIDGPILGRYNYFSRFITKNVSQYINFMSVLDAFNRNNAVYVATYRINGHVYESTYIIRAPNKNSTSAAGVVVAHSAKLIR